MRGPFFALALLVPLAASAQSLPGLGNISSVFTLSVDPQYPAPYSQPALSVESTSLDLANATLTVSANGKNIYRGSVQTVHIPLGKAGSVTGVDVAISSGGATYTQTISIQAQDVSLVVEPISSAPPLYPGKPLVPIEGSARVIAVANMQKVNGTRVDPSALSYTWTVDGTRIAESSGIGKNSVIVASPLPYRVRNVSVAIGSQDGTLVGGDSLSFSPQQPSVRIYENDPLLGIRFDRALVNSFNITGSESTFYAAPFSVATTLGAPSLQWFLNGSPAQTGSSLTLRPTGGEGSASLSVTASAGGTTAASVNLPLTFGKTSSTNFLGL